MTRDATPPRLTILRWPLLLPMLASLVLAGSNAQAVPAPAAPDRSLPAIAQALLREAHRAGVGSLERAIAMTKIATAETVARDRLSYPPGTNALPSWAVRALIATVGDEADPRAIERVRALDRLPAESRMALAATIDAFARFHRASEEAYLSPPKATIPWAASPPEVLLEARMALLDGILALRAAFLHTPPLVGGPIQVPPHLSIDVEGTDTFYPKEQGFRLTIDLGGDDTYLNNAGGNGVFGCFTADGNGIAGALIDLAGDDRYGERIEDGSFGATDCGRNGGAYGAGAGFLVDADGNDVYSGDDRGINGGGYSFGYGFLLDASGDDHYVADDIATNGGAGSAGAGVLLDAQGDDTYVADGSGANGGAFLGGQGSLIDVRGDDVYAGGDGGVNGGGGINGALLANPSGLLLDVTGDDAYLASGGTGTNGGAGNNFVPVGTLLDASGVDRYQDPTVPGGAARDCTIVPKGTIGSQSDMPSVGCATTIPAVPSFDLPRSRRANDNEPVLRGRAGAGATVTLFTDRRCTGAIAGTAVADGAGAFAASIAVADDTTTVLHAEARKGGETSICSPYSFRYEEDSTAPAITLEGPVPAPGFTVLLSGRAGQAVGDLPTVTVQVYGGEEATGDPVSTVQVSPEADGSWSLEVELEKSGIYTAQAAQGDDSGNEGLSSARTFMLSE